MLQLLWRAQQALSQLCCVQGVVHARVHVTGDILFCRSTTGIRQKICSRSMCDVACVAVVHVARVSVKG